MKPTKDVLLAFLRDVDKEFNPPLSQKQDLSLFADKLSSKAVLFYEFSELKELKGLVVLYANDFEKKYAYYPLVVVHPNFRNQGVASRLMKASLQYVFSLKNLISVVGIHTNNSVALKLYQCMGFESKSMSNGRYYLELKLP